MQVKVYMFECINRYIIMGVFINVDMCGNVCVSLSLCVCIYIYIIYNIYIYIYLDM